MNSNEEEPAENVNELLGSSDDDDYLPCKQTKYREITPEEEKDNVYIPKVSPLSSPLSSSESETIFSTTAL